MALGGSRCAIATLLRSVTYQLVGAVGFVVHAESVDDGGAGFVKTQHVHLGAFSAQLDHHFVQCSDRGDVPEMRAAQVDRDLGDRLLESNALMNLSAELKNTWPATVYVR